MDLTLYTEAFIREKSVLLNVTPKTAGWYRGSLRIFSPCLKVGCTKASALEVLAELKGRGVHPQTINSYTRAVNSFISWLDEEKILPKGYRVPRLLEPETRHRIWQYSDIARLVAARPEGSRTARIHTVGVLLLDTGMRISECLGLRWDDVSLHPRMLHVLGKGRRERRIPYSLVGERVILRWKKISSCKDGLMFESRTRSVLNYSNIDDDWKELCASVGVPRCGFHLLRHTFATLYLRAGGDLMTLQAILGHSTLSMTQKYITLNPSDLCDSHSRFSPTLGEAETGLKKR